MIYVLALVQHGSPFSLPLVAIPHELSERNAISRPFSALEKRFAPMNLGTFSLAITLPRNDLLFTDTMKYFSITLLMTPVNVQ